jgi:CheY-like chemotaxis protein
MNATPMEKGNIMKYALVLERDPSSSEKTSQLLRWLGYVTAPVQTPVEALNVAGTISFDVIVTCTAVQPNERRSLTGELKRAAPEAAVVLIADEDEENPAARARKYPGTSAVLARPPSVEALRKVVEFGIDGSGLQPIHVPPSQERRRNRP